jgi:SAM-dependent methyltransferase
LIKRYINRGSILEIGAGGGYFLDEAKKAGFEVSGIELNGKQAQFINDHLKIDCETAPLNEASFKEKNFDLIYHCDVISHFYDPIYTFNLINLKLKDKGFVVFETGNLGDVDYQYYKYISCFQYPDHLFFFSEYSLEKLLEQTGFELIKIYKYSIIPQLILSKKTGFIINAVSGAFTRNILKEKGKGLYDTNNKNDRKLNSMSKLKQLAADIHGYLFYCIRYYVGSIYLKKRRPQTIIVVAQKHKM